MGRSYHWPSLSLLYARPLAQSASRIHGLAKDLGSSSDIVHCEADDDGDETEGRLLVVKRKMVLASRSLVEH